MVGVRGEAWSFFGFFLSLGKKVGSKYDSNKNYFIIYHICISYIIIYIRGIYVDTTSWRRIYMLHLLVYYILLWNYQVQMDLAFPKFPPPMLWPLRPPSAASTEWFEGEAPWDSHRTGSYVTKLRYSLENEDIPNIPWKMLGKTMMMRHPHLSKVLVFFAMFLFKTSLPKNSRKFFCFFQRKGPPFKVDKFPGCTSSISAAGSLQESKSYLAAEGGVERWHVFFVFFFVV